MFRCKNLKFTIQKNTLIENVSLTFIPGTLYGILGPNGSGKSTLFRTLAGLWKPTYGEVFWQDKPLLQAPRKEISKIISYVPQTLHLPFEFTVFDFVAMGRYPHEPGTTDREIIENALILVDALHLSNKKITRLSQGERQRVLIARSLATETAVLLLDEPTANLDIRHQIDTWKLLRHLSKSGKIILVAHHDLTTACQVFDEVVLIHQGHVIATGPPAQVLTKHHLKEVFEVENCSMELHASSST